MYIPYIKCVQMYVKNCEWKTLEISTQIPQKVQFIDLLISQGIPQNLWIYLYIVLQHEYSHPTPDNSTLTVMVLSLNLYKYCTRKVGNLLIQSDFGETHMREVLYQKTQTLYVRLLENIYRKRDRIQKYAQMTLSWHLNMKLSFCLISF